MGLGFGLGLGLGFWLRLELWLGLVWCYGKFRVTVRIRGRVWVRVVGLHMFGVMVMVGVKGTLA